MHVMKSVYGQASVTHVVREPNDGSASNDIISPAAFDRAATDISQWPGYEPSPLIQLPALARAAGVGQVAYKDESGRFGVGSFKALGAPYAAAQLLQRELARDGQSVSSAAISRGEAAHQCGRLTLVSATDGNHGRALAWGAQRFGARCRIYIHAQVSEHRERVMSDLGATVVRIDGDYDESVRVAQRDADRNAWFVVSDTSWEGYVQPPTDVMAGYGVMVDEIVATNIDAPTHVFVQGGVGGLAGAVSARLTQRYGRQTPRIVVVEPELAACLQASARAGSATAVAVCQETVMAGLSCGVPSPLGWAILAQCATDFLTISDALVAPTMRLLGYPADNDPPIVAGESAVAGLAALLASSQQPALSRALGLSQASRILVLGTEGNTDPQIYDQMMAA